MAMGDVLATLRHAKWGDCDLIRVEGTDWIVRLASNGKLYRFPPSIRPQFIHLGGDVSATNELPSLGDPAKGIAVVEHPELGIGDLLRLDVTDWIIRFRSNGKTYKYPFSARSRLKVVEDFTPQRRFTPQDAISPQAGLTARDSADELLPQVPNHSATERPSSHLPRPDRTTLNTPVPAEQTSPRTSYPPLAPESRVVKIADVETKTPVEFNSASTSPPAGAQDVFTGPFERRKALRVIESLRVGLPPIHAEARELAVGFHKISKAVDNLLEDVDKDGGRAIVIQGAYGQGKTFALKLLEELALESGFVVLRTEIDATENRLNKPHHIYHDLMVHLRVPGVQGSGKPALQALTAKTQKHIRDIVKGAETKQRMAWAGYELMTADLGCPPLAWLLSDPEFDRKPLLASLLMCEPGVPVSLARRSHEIPGRSLDWPVFNAGTQGDFASFLLSGLGRLSRMLGYKGMIVVMDEMEKWQDLNWREQTQAGNLLGGLVWGTSAELGKRGRNDHPSVLWHSARAGGFPFTTKHRTHIGVAIAMTPRGEDSPETLWLQYGMMEMVRLPELTDVRLGEYCEKIAPHYATAYGLPSPANGQLTPIARHAVSLWKKSGELTTRSGIQSAIIALDRWRGLIDGEVA